MREGGANEATVAHRLVLQIGGSGPCKLPPHSVRMSLDLIKLLLYHVGERRDIHWAAYSRQLPRHHS